MIDVLFILLALLILDVIVFFHELGHYIAGRACGIGIEEFAIGMGPKIVSFARGGIRYSLRAVPIGGYCRFVGEDGEGDDSAPNAMNRQPVWKRFITVLSGPLLNFVLAFLAAVLFFIVFGTEEYRPLIRDTIEASPAQIAGFMPGDKVAEIDGLSIPYDESGYKSMIERIGEYGGEGPMRFVVDRGGKRVELSVAPRQAEDGNLEIGIWIGSENVPLGFGRTIAASARMVASASTAMIDGLRGMIFGGEGLGEVMGPVGIVTFVAQEARAEANTVFILIMLISVNLGVVNLLPIPALDGARLWFLIVEAIRKKPVKPEYEGRVHAIGLLLMLLLLLVISYRDILRLFKG